MRKGEPGESYVTALRRWPNEVARITNAELASRIGLRQSHLSTVLQNGQSWTATPTLLRHALKIIEVSGGTLEDLGSWTAYHYEVATHQATIHKLPVPTPPTPVRFAEPRDFTPARRGSSWFMPVPDTRGVVARPELLDDIVRALQVDSARVALTGLEGAGGFGKTTLAALTCRDQRVLDLFPDGVLWKKLGQRVTDASITTVVNELTYYLTGERPPYTDVELAGAHLGRVVGERKCLLVLDGSGLTRSPTSRPRPCCVTD